MTKMFSDIKKLMLVCNRSGDIERVNVDDLQLLRDITLPAGLHHLVAPQSLEHLGVFWADLLKSGFEEGHLIRLLSSGHTYEFVFSGYRMDGMLILCATNQLSHIEIALKDLLAINNEQQNLIRQVEKQLSKLHHNKKAIAISDEILDDFTKLNNELVNAQRMLIQSNTQVKKLNDQLSNNVQMMEAFSYSVSHDLKEPVRMVKSFMTLLNTRYGDRFDEKATSYVHFALNGATLMEAMIQDLLHYHRLGREEEKQEIVLESVISGVNATLSLLIEEKAAEILVMDTPSFLAPKRHVNVIIQNLVSNALIYSDPDRKPLIRIGGEETPDEWVFYVTDNGVGIEKKNYEMIFGIFKRLGGSKDHDNTGMGLAIVKKLVESLGGRIWLESELGKGSTFYFTIPKVVT